MGGDTGTVGTAEVESTFVAGTLEGKTRGIAPETGVQSVRWFSEVEYMEEIASTVQVPFVSGWKRRMVQESIGTGRESAVVYPRIVREFRRQSEVAHTNLPVWR